MKYNYASNMENNYKSTLKKQRVLKKRIFLYKKYKNNNKGKAKNKQKGGFFLDEKRN